MHNNYQNMGVFQMYDWLRKAYSSLGLYNDKEFLLAQLGTDFENINALGNPIERSVEFFVSKILNTNSINVVADNPAVVDAINQVYEWSNFIGKKSAYIRDYALLGDVFFKVYTTEDKVLIESVDPSNVTSINKDKRGNITEIRIDIRYMTDDYKYFWYIEYWDKESHAVWENVLNKEIPLGQLGAPNQYNFNSVYGIDFVPFVHVPFRDVNKTRGQSCVYHALDKIDELNRIITRLHEQIFIGSNRAWFLDITNKQTGKLALPFGLGKTQKEGAIIEVSGTPISAVPNLPYKDLLDVVKNMQEELIQDLPELRAYSITEGRLSGKAIALLLEPAIERAEEAENNLVHGLERVNNIALTLGIYAGLFPSSLGTYERGDFAHKIEPEDMRALPVDEKALGLTELTKAGVPLYAAMEIAGYSQDEIDLAAKSAPTTGSAVATVVPVTVLPSQTEGIL
jgi:hypothetical protein